MKRNSTLFFIYNNFEQQKYLTELNVSDPADLISAAFNEIETSPPDRLIQKILNEIY